MVLYAHTLPSPTQAHTLFILVLDYFETGSHYVAQAGLNLPSSCLGLPQCRDYTCGPSHIASCPFSNPAIQLKKKSKTLNLRLVQVLRDDSPEWISHDSLTTPSVPQSAGVSGFPLPIHTRGENLRCWSSLTFLWE